MKVKDQQLWDWFTSKFKEEKPIPVYQPIQNIPFVSVLDLHELSVQDAYDAVKKFVLECREQNVRSCIVITGRSGQIKREFLNWMDLNPNVLLAVAKNEGSFRVALKKN